MANVIKKALLATLVVMLILSASAAFSSPVANAQVPFGGMRIAFMPCTCSANFLIYLQDFATYKLLRLIYQPGVSLINLYGNPFATYLLGTYNPGAGVCKMYAGTGCVDIASDGMLGIFPGTGTSGI